MTTDRTFKTGCMWEGDPWKIRFNEECSGFGGGEPCPHCVDDHVKANTRFDGSTYKKRAWVCPRVVVAYNEGGHNSTGVCLDCILAAVATL